MAANLKLVRSDGEDSRLRIKKLLAKRAETQPTSLPSCGSVFRNPKDDYSARLIDELGLKGLCIGGACVSDKHANFIINTGDAMASDIEKLIEKVQSIVEHKQGIRLVREVCIVGEASSSVKKHDIY